MTPDEFAARVALAWSARTASTYTPANPPRGQCSVTAILAQEKLGGDLLKTSVGGAWHWYNRIGGERYDFTANQFPAVPTYADLPSDRADALTDTTEPQIAALAKAFATSSPAVP